MKKRFLSILMALCMMLTLAVPSVAAGDTVDPPIDETSVTQETEGGTEGQEPPETPETPETPEDSTPPASPEDAGGPEEGGETGDSSSGGEESVPPEEDNSAGVARIGNHIYDTLDDAVDAAEEDDADTTIELLGDATTAGLNLYENLTIVAAQELSTEPTITFTNHGIALGYGASNQGKNAPKLTFKNVKVVMNNVTYNNAEWSWNSICSSQGGSLTLDNVEMTMDASGATNDPHAIYFSGNNYFNIINGSVLKISNYSHNALEWNGGDEGYFFNIENSTFISDHNRCGFTGTFYATITNSKVDVINSTGNGSNGSHFIITDSTVNFNDNGSHGLSAGELKIMNSTVTANNNRGMGITVNNAFTVENSTVTVMGNAVNSSYGYAAVRLYNNYDFSVDKDSKLYIKDNNNTGLYVRQGNLTVADGAVLEITGNKVSHTLLDGYGGGIYVGYGDNYDPTVTIPGDAKIYNNHSLYGGDDIYVSEGVTGPKLTFGPVGTDWYLDGASDCYHGIDGWYDDSSGTRWEAHAASEEGNYIEKFNGNTAETGDFTITDQHALKAAHGKLAAITVTPADITIYMGGDDGYEAVVGEDGESAGTVTETNSLPKPMFQITAPENVDPVDLTFTTSSEEKSWTVEKAGETADGGALYYLEAAENQDPVRVQFVRDGQAIVSDEFEPTTAGEMYLDYKIQLYTNTVNPASITVTDQNGATYELGAVGEGTLRVRAVDDTENDNNPVTPVTGAISQPVEAGKGAVTAPAGTTYTLNDTTVPVEGTGVGLLFDGIIDDETHDRTGALTDRVDDTMGDPGRYTTRHYQAQYLDLVDADNGNAWVKASGEVTVYWGYPEGTGPWMDFTLYHFQDLHRDGNNSGFEINDVASADMEEVTITTDRNGISFDVSSGGFSPFVLVWETTHYPPVDPDPDPDPTPDPDPEDPDKPELNTEDHYAYIVGYPDGNVKPEGNITRAEVATIFFRLLTDESRDEFWSQTNDYTDVPADAWYNNAVSTLSNAGVIDGYEDGTFKPDGNITRAEFATIAVRFFEATYDGEDLFSDIAGHWAQDYINEAANAGIVDGYPDGTFRPQQLITRAEAMTMVNRTIDRHPDADHLLEDMITWPDNPETAWYYEQVQEATNSHEYTMNTDDEQNPYEIWTELLPVRDWAQLEKEWSDAHSGQSGGDVV